jgi:transcription-repair coupling factor (superfamily II helicase)
MNLSFFRETDPFKRVLKAVVREENELELTGLVEPSKPFFLASLVSESRKRVVFIRPSYSSLSDMAEQCQVYLSLLSTEARSVFLPPLLSTPYKDIPPSLESVSKRMKFFYDLLYDPPQLVITNLHGLLWPFPKPESLRTLFFEITQGEILGRDPLIERLRAFGYRKEAVVNAHGEYAWRGGIVDVFSPWHEYPFRIELSGNEVASLREFDLSSQRSVRKIDRLLIPAMYEFPLSSAFAEEWAEAASRGENDAGIKEVREIKKNLVEGKVQPHFYPLALLASEFFMPFQHFLEDSVFILDDWEESKREWDQTWQEYTEEHADCRKSNRMSLPPEKIFTTDAWTQTERRAMKVTLLGPAKENTCHFPFSTVPRFNNKIPFFLEYLKKSQENNQRTTIFFSGAGVRQKLHNLLVQYEIPARESSDALGLTDDESVSLALGKVVHGFSYPQLKFSFFSEQDIFTEERVLVSRRRVRPFVSQFRDLKMEDYVVHTDYGIGIFKGLIKMDVDKNLREFIEIVYKDSDRLYVPVEDLNLVQKYSSSGTSLPFLNKLGTPNWNKTKERTKKSIETMAKELLHLYAQRKAVKGHAFVAGGSWQIEFDGTFEHEETEDQKRTIEEVMRDMESPTPMDRLLCGDVGFGKTEVAIRAAFKAVMDGKQVAVLCPTTVLASQHLQTFRHRMILFPVSVEGLTRLQTKAQQNDTLQRLANGQTDIIIGTHRLLSQDVRFKDLGLLVIDEEQRFGVKHKEKLKRMRTKVDVLTMTATPIPRTLNLSLSGLQDISIIETPPKDRLAIHTVVTPFSRELITSAIRRELVRGGQVYFIHNRIEDIASMAQTIEKWVPEARVTAVHGQMSGYALEKRMISFIQGETNVLISTTIIENGIDIPLVNTLFVNRADRFGLAQLYQLRGRVGRSSRQAVAYFLVPPLSSMTPLATERLKALKEFSELGSGFRLAAKDLEIRGAGHFLGSRQHGFMEAVGFEYYIHLLESAVRRLKGELEEEIKSEINLKVDVRIPEEYLPQMDLRLSLYKRISSVENLEELDLIREEIEDRFGPLPQGVENVLNYGAIKWLSHRLRIRSLDRIGQKIVFGFLPSSTADVSQLARIMDRYQGSLTPQGILNLRLKARDESAVLVETIDVLKELTLM